MLNYSSATYLLDIFRVRCSHDHSVQPPIQWLPGAISPRIKRLGREGDHSILATAEVKNGRAIPLLLHVFSCHST
jgi:hypothetical protein